MIDESTLGDWLTDLWETATSNWVMSIVAFIGAIGGLLLAANLLGNAAALVVWRQVRP